MIEKIKQSSILFSEIEDDILRKHIEVGFIVMNNYKSGITLYNQGELCDSLTIVLEGNLIAYALSENGSAIKMFEFKKEHMIGANLLFGTNHEYPLNIYCLSECELLHIKKEAVLEFLNHYPFVMEYVKYLSLNSQGLNQKIKIFVHNTLRDNLMDYIKQQAVLQKSQIIMLPISKRELADYLGVQRPSLFRELKKLKDEKVIEIDNRHIKIL